jgi:hypothetical protein
MTCSVCGRASKHSNPVRERDLGAARVRLCEKCNADEFMRREAERRARQS